jgi:putative spermidine/putrescine transport system permease protein
VLSAQADLATQASLVLQPDRAVRPRARMLRLLPGVLLRAIVALVYLFLLGPIAVIVATSFSPTHSMAFPPPGFSFRWYGTFLHSANFTAAFRFSLVLGISAAAIATVIGFLTAYAARRLMQRRGGVVQSLAMLPLLIPHLLISISLLMALNFVSLPDSASLLAGHVLICTPFTVAGVTASLDGVDAQLESAAMTLGASRLTALLEVVVPLVAPGVLSAFLFAFVVSFGDVYIALFLSGPGTTTLPIEIFSYVQWESSPVIAAITSVQIMMIVVLGLVIEKLVGLRKIMRI